MVGEDRWSKQRPEEEGDEQNREENRGITLAVPGAGKKKLKKVVALVTMTRTRNRTKVHHQRCWHGKEIEISSWDRKDTIDKALWE